MTATRELRLPRKPISASQPGANSCWTLRLYICVTSGGKWGSRTEKKFGLVRGRLNGLGPKIDRLTRKSGSTVLEDSLMISFDGGFTVRTAPLTISGNPKKIPYPVRRTVFGPN